MKVLVFHIGADRYGLALQDVGRVLPAAALKQVPLAPPSVAGVLDLHGEPVPVIDLARLAGHAREAVYVDTRIVLVDYRPSGGAVRPLGLLADQVSGIMELGAADLKEAGVAGPPFLGKVVTTPAGMLQMVDVAQLLTPEVRALLYPSGAAA
jgi:chemotaxis-related protein WspB